MRKKSKSSSFQADQLEIRQLLSAVIYVSSAAPVAPQNGTSWATAFQTLQSGLSAAKLVASSSNPVVIKVGQGNYYAGGRTFQLLDNVAIDGGYAGYGQTNPDVRAPATYPSVLSGQFGAGNAESGSIHVVTGSGTNSTAILDGFTITGGDAHSYGDYQIYGGGIFDNAGSPTLNDCTITGNSAFSGGGGMYNFNYSSPTLTNCTISGNTAGSGGGIGNTNHSSPTLINCIISGNTVAGNGAGGGMYNKFYSSPVLTNCTLSGNTASNGGGMGNGNYCSPVLTNCTISGNTANTIGGGMANGYSFPTLTNCILWGDSAKTSGNEIANGDGTLTITYSDIEQSGFTGTGDLDTDPMFIRNAGTLGATDFGDLRLRSASPAINAGSNSAVSVTTDVDGLSRIAGGHVDMGAYESHWALQSTIYVDASATGAPTGSDWADAYPNLAAALDYAVSGETIDVAQGIYKPTVDTNRCDTFQLVSGVNIEGGFAGQVNPTAAQNVSAYPTILSGVLGSDVKLIPSNPVIVPNINSYHVVTGSGTNATALLNGFTITAGNANGNGDTNYLFAGGGILDLAGSPTLNNCTITGNSATAGAGMANYNSSPILTNCTITGNDTENPATIGVRYLLFPNDGGGIMDNNASSPTLTNCILSRNTGSHFGGGIYNTAESNPTLNDCILSGNSAPTGGGGMESNASSATLTGCIVTGNTSNLAGGGIDGSGSTLTDCTITGNTANNNGGGISGSATLTNCTISGNRATDSGGGISGSVTLTNCILWGDTASQSGNEISGTVTITYSDIAGGYAGTGNINANPMFIRNVGTNGTTDYGDLHLQFTSPAIDAGSNAAVPAGVTTDLDGNPRIFDFPGANNGAGAVVDMGAYELGYNLDEVIVPASQTVALPAGGYPFSASQLIIGTGGTLDVADDYLTINYGTGTNPASSIASLISTGYANGNWTGTGIISSNTLGEPANSTGVGEFDNGAQVKIARTWDGDANVDGIINSDDLSLVMLGQAQTGTRWQDGNFNYDTQVNADDWIKLMYAVAYSHGQMRPSAIVNAATPAKQVIQTSTTKLASPAFAQTPIESSPLLTDLLDSPLEVL